MNGVTTHRAWSSEGSTRRRSHPLPDVVELFQARLADEQDLRAHGRGDPAPSRGAIRIERSRRAARRTGRVAGKSPRRRMGVGGSGLLLVLGESPADRRAVAYVARLLGRRRGFRVYVVSVLPEFPSSLLEHGGAGDPEVEERLSAALRAHRRAWVVERRKAALPLIDWASTRLRNAGLPARALRKRFCGPVSEVGAADEILRLARANHCQTIVVARRTRSWLGSLFGGDLRTQLARRTSRVAIWGIG